MRADEETEIVVPEGATVRELLRVSPGGGPIDLGAVDPRSTPGLPAAAGGGKDRKPWARRQVELIGAGLARQQEMLFATAKAAGEPDAPTSAPTGGGSKLRPGRPGRLLLVLQAMDCGGKDGTVKRVAGAMNPLGLHIRSFGPPTRQELRHDFLWRIRRALPPPGYVGVFNRSHYEDVLVARVDALVPEATWRARYDEINAFERELTDGGVTLVKVMLHISYDEQARAAVGAADRPDEALEVPARAISTPGPAGTTTRPRTRRRWAGAARTPRPGTWCRRTASGTATGRWRTCCGRRSTVSIWGIPLPVSTWNGSASGCSSGGGDGRGEQQVNDR